MQRERAVQLVTDVLERLVAATAEYPLTLVDELHVFGSFARGAPEPHDVDLAVEYTADDEYRGRQIWLMRRSRNPNTDLRAALAGRSRGLQFQFRELENLHAAGIATTLLWRRGDTLSAALDRLTAIQPDPNAGRAPRDEMHPAFEGIDRWVPRPARSLLTIWEDAGAVSLHQVDLPDAPVRDAHAAQVIDRNWVAASPLRRAANNASAYLAAHGVSLRAVHLQPARPRHRRGKYTAHHRARMALHRRHPPLPDRVRRRPMARGAPPHTPTTVAGPHDHRR